MNVRYRVELSQAERDELMTMLSGGKRAARKLKRAQILLAADAGRSDEEIARTVPVSGSTVYRTKRRCGRRRAAKRKPRGLWRLSRSRRSDMRSWGVVGSGPLPMNARCACSFQPAQTGPGFFVVALQYRTSYSSLRLIQLRSGSPTFVAHDAFLYYFPHVDQRRVLPGRSGNGQRATAV